MRLRKVYLEERVEVGIIAGEAASSEAICRAREELQSEELVVSKLFRRWCLSVLKPCRQLPLAAPGAPRSTSNAEMQPRIGRSPRSTPHRPRDSVTCEMGGYPASDL